MTGFHSFVLDPLSDEFVELYKNPTINDLKGLRKELRRRNYEYIRFMIYEMNLYVWNAMLLHETIISHLNFNINSEYTNITNIHIALFGIGLILPSGLIDITNTLSDFSINDSNKIYDIYYLIFNKYFSPNSYKNLIDARKNNIKETKII